MRVHLIDGTYELFRQHFGQVSRHGDAGPNDAAIGVVSSTLQLVTGGATHLGVASDHVIESFRNDLYPGYKTSEGMDPVLLHQIPVMEEALVACGFTTWDMVEWEADDALAAAAAVAEADSRVEQVLIVTPDKDLCQCVRGTRVVQYDRRKDEIVDEAESGLRPNQRQALAATVGVCRQRQHLSNRPKNIFLAHRRVRGRGEVWGPARLDRRLSGSGRRLS